ncbi:MAG TPA: PrsW family glutamic-type intramembrane protease [Gemmataceae bacterium]|jgi:RsiW-degrading membrane proteinase PrsW (M82 family)|nr:PrsW family glutamic-type intramembrane protease [Gemmataceae bacterium]
MVIEVKCPCGKRLRANESLIGQTIQCNLCRRETVVPDPNAAPPEPLIKEPPPPVADNQSPWEYAYWLLALAFLPLAISLAQGPDDTKDRFQRALEANPDVKKKLQKKMEETEEPPTLDEIISAFPGKKLDQQAFHPRDTKLHYAYALVACGVFLGLFFCFFSPGTFRPWHLVLVGLFTGTFGIAGLLIVHEFGIFTLLVHVGMMPGEDKMSDFLACWAGFTFGVGLVEEACKIVPLFVLYQYKKSITWRTAVMWGLASGVGFGVNEGILYSETFYNGITPAMQYVVRFVSCVALHAIWSASAGLSLYFTQPLLNQFSEWYEKAVVMLRVLIVVMFLHGLFDALLTRELRAPALLVAAASIAWLGWQIESARKQEMRVAQPAPELPKIDLASLAPQG